MPEFRSHIKTWSPSSNALMRKHTRQGDSGSSREALWCIVASKCLDCQFKDQCYWCTLTYPTQTPGPWALPPPADRETFSSRNSDWPQREGMDQLKGATTYHRSSALYRSNWPRWRRHGRNSTQKIHSNTGHMIVHRVWTGAIMQ